MKNEKKPLIQYAACACFAISAVTIFPLLLNFLALRALLEAK